MENLLFKNDLEERIYPFVISKDIRKIFRNYKCLQNIEYNQEFEYLIKNCRKWILMTCKYQELNNSYYPDIIILRFVESGKIYDYIFGKYDKKKDSWYNSKLFDLGL